MTTACKLCANEMEADAGVCARCGAPVAEAEQAPAAPPISTPPLFSAISPRSDLQGIGGWLILVAIGLAFSPFQCLHGVYVDLRVLYGVGFQLGLASQPGLAFLVLFEAATNSIFLIGLIGLNLLFYRKKRAFPVWMIAYLAIHMGLILIDEVLAMLFGSHAGLSAVAGGVIQAAIWIPYLLKSERVKATFVN
jgi:hypothetical protein